MLPDKDITCHHTAHKKKCRDLCMNCPKWIQVQGHNPNTGVAENQWNCADNWMVFLTIENSQQQRQTAAAVESFRNETVKQSDILIGVVSGQAPARLKNK